MILINEVKFMNDKYINEKYSNDKIDYSLYFVTDRDILGDRDLWSAVEEAILGSNFAKKTYLLWTFINQLWK